MAPIALGACIIFDPIVLLATFVYGNALALLLDLLAWRIALRALRTDASVRRQALQLLGASAALALAALIKQTMVIVSIAFAVTVAAYAVRTRSVRVIILILGSALLYVFWESKSMYLMPYIVFMMPQACVGWGWAADAVSKRFA